MTITRVIEMIYYYLSDNKEKRRCCWKREEWLERQKQKENDVYSLEMEDYWRIEVIEMLRWDWIVSIQSIKSWSLSYEATVTVTTTWTMGATRMAVAVAFPSNFSISQGLYDPLVKILLCYGNAAIFLILMEWKFRDYTLHAKRPTNLVEDLQWILYVTYQFHNFGLDLISQLVWAESLTICANHNWFTAAIWWPCILFELIFLIVWKHLTFYFYVLFWLNYL